jgi:hypothetical protein
METIYSSEKSGNFDGPTHRQSAIVTAERTSDVRLWISSFKESSRGCMGPIFKGNKGEDRTEKNEAGRTERNP